MINKEPIPRFASEAEEAEWWYEQRDRIGENAEAALAGGELKPRRLPPSPTTNAPARQATHASPDATDVLKLSYVDMGTSQVPGPDAQLWRFMDLAKLVSMLDRDALYFSVLSALDDKLEGALPSLPPDADEDEKRNAWRVWCDNRSVMFVNCWHNSPGESAAMWALYGNHGIAIRTTFGSLSQAVHQRPASNPPVMDQTVFGGMVSYIDPDDTSQPGTVSHPVTDALTKRCWYEYEKEVRLLYHLPDNCERFAGFPFAKEKGKWVKCNLSAAISMVVLAPSSPPFLEEAVRAVWAKFGLDPSRVRRSRIEEGVPSAWTFSEVARGT